MWRENKVDALHHLGPIRAQYFWILTFSRLLFTKYGIPKIIYAVHHFRFCRHGGEENRIQGCLHAICEVSDRDFQLLFCYLHFIELLQDSIISFSYVYANFDTTTAVVSAKKLFLHGLSLISARALRWLQRTLLHTTRFRGQMASRCISTLNDLDKISSRIYYKHSKVSLVSQNIFSSGAKLHGLKLIYSTICFRNCAN